MIVMMGVVVVVVRGNFRRNAAKVALVVVMVWEKTYVMK
jgi:hypothetical protein